MHVPVQILAGEFKLEFLPTVILDNRNSILNFPPKFEQEWAEPFCVVMTHHRAKANLEKGSSWPPEAKQKVRSYDMGLVLTQPISPTPWT